MRQVAIYLDIQPKLYHNSIGREEEITDLQNVAVLLEPFNPQSVKAPGRFVLLGIIPNLLQRYS